MSLNNFTSSSSEHLKSCSSPNEKNSLEISSVIDLSNDTSKTKDVVDNNQINEEECKFIINVLKSNDVDLHSQNELMLLNIVKKYEKDILPSNNENMELNTQTCMDLLLHKATIDLQKHEDVSKNQTIELMDSDDIIISTPPSKFKEINSKESNENVITVKNNQDEDPDLITFKNMCNALLRIASDDNVIPNSNLITKKNNQENLPVFKPVNADVLICENNMDCVPGTSKLNSDICYKLNYDSSEIVSSKKRKFKNLMLDSSEESSPEHLNKLSQKQYSLNKKFKFYSSTNILINNTEYHSDNIVISKQVNDSKKKINTFVRKEETGYFYCAPDGKIHQDMLAFISKQKYGC